MASISSRPQWVNILVSKMQQAMSANDGVVYSSIYASLSLYVWTHLPLDKMAAILADDMFKCIFLNENICISNKISLKYVLWVFIDNRSVLVQKMAWCQPGDKPLSEPMLTWLIHWHIYAALGGDELRNRLQICLVQSSPCVRKTLQATFVEPYFTLNVSILLPGDWQIVLPFQS